MKQTTLPNQHIMAFVTFCALVPLVYIIPEWLTTFLPDNKLLNVIVAVGMIVPIISYVVMPVFVRQCQRIKQRG